MKPEIPQITPAELKQLRDTKTDVFVLDVREPWEYQTANIGGHLIPLNELPKRASELDPEQEIVVHCKMGGRSQQAAEFLYGAGFHKVRNLTGGIDAWSQQVDPSVPRY